MRHEPMGQTVIRNTEMTNAFGRSAGLSELSRLWWRAGHALLGRTGGNAWNTLRVWRQRAHNRNQDRRALQLFSPSELRDLGATRQQILFDINKPFWRA